MKIRPKTIVLIVILACTLFMAGTLFTYNEIKTILVPAMVCSVILVVGAFQLKKEFGERANIGDVVIEGATIGKVGGGVAAESSRNLDEEAKRQRNIMDATGVGLLVGYAIGIYLIGFMYATFLFVAPLLRFHGNHSWFKSGVIAFVVTAVFWVLFIYLLKSDLYGGSIFEWLDLNIPTLTEV
jgi:hypothetical protein